jgi:hypothetical protein
VKIQVLQPIHAEKSPVIAPAGRNADVRVSMYPAGHLGVSHGEKLESPDGVYDVDPALAERLIAEGKAMRA